MPKLAAGLLMYRQSDQGPEVLLVHPGGPFFRKRGEGCWSLPKGLADEGEVGDRLLQVAKREFEDETGVKPSGRFHYLGAIRRRFDDKTVEIWAFSGNCETAMGTEVGRAAFFTLEQARIKLSAYLKPVIDLLEKHFHSR